MLFSFTRISGNKKTGPIPVTTSPMQTCPDVCPLKAGGCYANGGPLRIHWKALSDGSRGVAEGVLFDSIWALPTGTLWRHNQAGDLVHTGGSINYSHIKGLTDASKGKRGFTYTHHDPAIGQNAYYIKQANDNGFTINLSGNDVAHADQLKALNIGPVVTMVDEWQPGQAKVTYTPAGNKVVICPAVTIEGMDCARCGLCAVSDRDYIIGFPVHGTQKKKARVIALRVLN